MSYDNTIRLFVVAWIIGILLVGFGGGQNSYDHPEEEK
jgi:hypothetical protein